MTYRLTPEQSQQWEQGGWLAFEVEEDVVEYLIAHDITEPTTVVLDNGAIAFAVTPPGVIFEN